MSSSRPSIPCMICDSIEPLLHFLTSSPAYGDCNDTDEVLRSFVVLSVPQAYKLCDYPLHRL